MMRFASATCIALVLCSGTSALGQQSYGESMADCSALYLVLARNVQREENVERLTFASQAWASAALDNGMSQEGILARVREKAVGWDVQPFDFTDEMKEWASYCRAFARETGVQYDSEQ